MSELAIQGQGPGPFGGEMHHYLDFGFPKRQVSISQRKHVFL
jgi:hypothetical protein